MGRPKLYGTRVKLAVTDELIERVEHVRELRAARLGFEPPAADVYREALAVGLLHLERAEERAAVERDGPEPGG